ncbi:pollen-specific leucine-rich repeat extensin-like protein 1 [Galendromus occidentalis]|uniref:Pollen-specific leucine-rich repeat extensin-like protein 1 n=1 Tax=Galendromus occidentalis TaxID=34638 RepID=A0AAJ6QQE8_9ACAR|nr:pollen-specific leucine-rich repeat extensin-like protein 1 [Galendromus occidentalis]
MRVFYITIAVGLAICFGSANAQKKTAKKSTDAPAYDDYDDDYDAAVGDASSAIDGKPPKKASAESSSTTTTAPVEEDDSTKGSHPFFKNRLKLRNRPSPHPAVKTRPTLPSFIKHPANIEDLGHDHPPEKKATQPPLPRPRRTTSRPHKFSSTFYRKKTPPKEQPKDEYDYEETSEDAPGPQPSSPKPSLVSRPLRPRGRQ